MNEPEIDLLHDILQTLVYCARAADVRDTIINGRVVMRGRHFLTADEPALLDEAKSAGRKLHAQTRQSSVQRRALA